MRFAMRKPNLQVVDAKLINTHFHLVKLKVQRLIISEKAPEHEQITEVKHAARVGITPVCSITF